MLAEAGSHQGRRGVALRATITHRERGCHQPALGGVFECVPEADILHVRIGLQIVELVKRLQSELGTAVNDVSPEGVVLVANGRWRARTNRATPITAGDGVRVVAIDGVTLEVEPETGGARDYRERRPSASTGA